MTNPFFTTGGTVRPDARCYIERQADAELFQALLNGEFCYVLTARQMGKSSLMVRTATRLRARGAFVVALDLTASGRNLSPEQWYNGLLRRLGQQLNLESELEAYWEAQSKLGPLQRWVEALRQVVLPALRARTNAPAPSGPNAETQAAPVTLQLSLVIFIDEIDVVRSLPFSTDEFFAAIRETYNRRALEPAFHALGFCLLGVASPQDLIADSRLTPFNIGRRVELRDFTLQEAAPLAEGFRTGEAANSANKPTAHREGEALLKRVLHWTGGHPYLTQRLSAALVETQRSQSLGENLKAVDALCAEMFLSHKARQSDDNLVFVRERMLNSPEEKDALLDLYKQVLEGRQVLDNETNALTGKLRLAGITRSEGGRLLVRNRIYETAFDREWVLSNMSKPEAQRQKAAYKSGFRRGVIRGLAYVSLALLGILAVLVVEENLRGRIALARWVKAQAAAGKKARMEQIQMSPQKEDLAATYAGAERFTQRIQCDHNGTLLGLPDGSALCWQHLAEQVASWEESLSEIHQRLVDPPRLVRWNLSPASGSSTPGFVLLRQAAQMKGPAARSFAHEGELEAALRELTDLAKMARGRDKHTTLTEFMIRGAIMGVANSTASDVLNQSLWNDQALRLLAEAYQPRPAPADLENVLEVAQAEAAAGFEFLRTNSFAAIRRRWAGSQGGGNAQPSAWAQFVTPTAFWLWRVGLLDRTELHCHRTLELMVGSARMFPGSGQSVLAGTWKDLEKRGIAVISVTKFDRLFDRVLPPFAAIEGDYVAAFRWAFRLTLRNEVLNDLLRLGIAVRRFQIAQGKLPVQLADLVPEYLPTLPIDRLCGAPLRYRVESEQNWMAYSVGFDGVDNGGTRDPATNDELDIVFRQPSNLPP